MFCLFLLSGGCVGVVFMFRCSLCLICRLLFLSCYCVTLVVLAVYVCSVLTCVVLLCLCGFSTFSCVWCFPWILTFHCLCLLCMLLHIVVVEFVVQVACACCFVFTVWSFCRV